MKTEISIQSGRGSAWLPTAVVFAALLLPALDAAAVGFRLPNQDPEAIARGNAFAATADNPSAIYYNPAGISQLEGRNLDLGLYLVSAGDTFDGAGGASAKTKDFFQSVPQFYFTYSPEDSALSYGVGVYVPYGLSLDWGANPPFRNVAMKGSLLYATVNPVVAWKINDTLSIGGGPTINYSKAQVSQGIGLAPGDQFDFVGDDFDYSFTAGLLWKPTEMWAFGLNYRYQTSMKYRGHSTAQPSPPFAGSVRGSTASLRFPQYAVAGVSFRPTTNWNVEVDVDWTDWNNVKQINFDNTAIGNINLPLHYKSSFMYEIGATRQLGGGWYTSGGYFYSENSSPNEYFNPIVPDSNLNLWSLGLGRKGKRMDWAVSYTLAWSPGRQVSGSVFGPTVSGSYHDVNNAINLSANYKF